MCGTKILPYQDSKKYYPYIANRQASIGIRYFDLMS